MLTYEQGESGKQEFAASIVDDVDLTGIETGLKLRQWNIELEHGSMSVGYSEIGIFDQRSLVGLSFSTEERYVR